MVKGITLFARNERWRLDEYSQFANALVCS